MKKIIFVLILVVFTKIPHSFEMDEKDFSPINVNNNLSVIFESTLDEENYERIKVVLHDSESNIKKDIDILPFMGYTGKVNDAFIVKTGEDKQVLFIIQKFPIPNTELEPKIKTAP